MSFKISKSACKTSCTFVAKAVFQGQRCPKATLGILGLIFVAWPLFGQIMFAKSASASNKIEKSSEFDHSHAVWDGLLKKHVIAQEGGKATFLDYESLKKHAEASPFRSYLKSLSAVSEKSFNAFSKDEQLAFLINAYNAFIASLIVDNYPVTSIKSLGIPFVGPWKKSFIPLLGKKLSPDDLEHGIIRKNYQESRIHFGVNCASISCPPLRAEAFVASMLSEQLDEQATLFFANGAENSFNAKEKSLTLNPILDWFSADFSKTGPSGLVTYVSKYHSELKKTLDSGLGAKDIKVIFGKYNWDLNDSALIKSSKKE